MDTNERGGPDKCATEPEGFRIHRALVPAVAAREPSDVSSVKQRAVEPRDVNSVEQRAVDPSDVNNVGQRAAEPRVIIRVARGGEPRIWNIALARGPVAGLVVGLRPLYSVRAVVGGRP